MDNLSTSEGKDFDTNNKSCKQGTIGKRNYCMIYRDTTFIAPRACKMATTGPIIQLCLLPSIMRRNHLIT